MTAPVMAQLSTDRFSATRLSQTHPDPERIIDIPCADAFSIIVQLEDFADHRLWRGRHLSYSGGYRQGSVSLPYMGDELRCQHRASYDNLRLNIPRQTLDELQAEQGARRVDRLRYEQGQQDAVLYHLAQAMLPALQQPQESNRLFLDHILLAMSSHVLEHYGRIAPPSDSRSSCLTPQQERIAKELIDSHLGNELSVERIARECSLSRSHFSRAFKQSTGVAPHTWLLLRRVDKAKALLLSDPGTTLAHIALICGFSDQPHFTKVFARVVGMPPSVWRGLLRRRP